MAENIVDYQTLLADMETKKNILEHAITSLRAAIAAGALGRPGDLPPGTIPAGSPFSPAGGSAMDLPVGAFLNKSVPAAIKLYLSTIRKKQTTQQIAMALKEGGVESTADDFEKLVAGSLHRLKIAKEVLRFPDGWGYAEHYPEHIRKAISEETKPNRKKAKKTSKSKTKKETSDAKPKVVPIGGGLEKRILEVLNHAPSALGSTEIAKILNVNPTGTLLTLGRMAAKGTAEKAGNGYRAVKSA